MPCSQCAGNLNPSICIDTVDTCMRCWEELKEKSVKKRGESDDGRKKEKREIKRDRSWIFQRPNLSSTLTWFPSIYKGVEDEVSTAFPVKQTHQMYRRVSLAGAATSIIFVATNTCLSRQNTSFVATKVRLPRQNFCRDKGRVLSRQTCVCRNKSFAATEMCLSRQKISNPSKLPLEAVQENLKNIKTPKTHSKIKPQKHQTPKTHCKIKPQIHQTPKTHSKIKPKKTPKPKTYSNHTHTHTHTHAH